MSDAVLANRLETYRIYCTERMRAHSVIFEWVRSRCSRTQSVYDYPGHSAVVLMQADASPQELNDTQQVVG